MPPKVSAAGEDGRGLECVAAAGDLVDVLDAADEQAAVIGEEQVFRAGDVRAGRSCCRRTRRRTAVRRIRGRRHAGCRVPSPLAQAASAEQMPPQGLQPHSISIAIATASPPPMHSVAMPRLPPVFFSAPIRVAVMRAPEAPIGWPSAQAPPWMLTLVVRQAVLLHRRHGDHGEGLVDLPQVDVAGLPADLGEQRR